MEISKAERIANVLDGEPRELDDGTWIVLIERADGRVVTVSDMSVDEYADREALAAGRCYTCISLV